MMKASYVFRQQRQAEGVIDLDEATVKAYRNANSDEDRYEIVAALALDEVLGTPGTGVLSRDLDVSVFVDGEGNR